MLMHGRYGMNFNVWFMSLHVFPFLVSILDILQTPPKVDGEFLARTGDDICRTSDAYKFPCFVAVVGTDSGGMVKASQSTAKGDPR
jgi:hypothetical protein